MAKRFAILINFSLLRFIFLFFFSLFLSHFTFNFPKIKPFSNFLCGTCIFCRYQKGYCNQNRNFEGKHWKTLKPVGEKIARVFDFNPKLLARAFVFDFYCFFFSRNLNCFDWAVDCCSILLFLLSFFFEKTSIAYFVNFFFLVRDENKKKKKIMEEPLIFSSFFKLSAETSYLYIRAWNVHVHCPCWVKSTKSSWVNESTCFWLDGSSV